LAAKYSSRVIIIWGKQFPVTPLPFFNDLNIDEGIGKFIFFFFFLGLYMMLRFWIHGPGSLMLTTAGEADLFH
jgi:hypothetical protein